MADDGSAPRTQGSEPQSATGCLVRLGWLLGGIILLTPLVILIARGERWMLTVKDAAFWLILALVVVLRYADGRWFSATTANWEPATPGDIRRSLAILVSAWSALWILAQTLELG